MNNPLDIKVFSYRDAIAIMGRNLKMNPDGSANILSKEFLSDLTALAIGRLPELMEVEEIKIILSNK